MAKGYSNTKVLPRTYGVPGNCRCPGGPETLLRHRVIVSSTLRPSEPGRDSAMDAGHGFVCGNRRLLTSRVHENPERNPGSLQDG